LPVHVSDKDGVQYFGPGAGIHAIRRSHLRAENDPAGVGKEAQANRDLFFFATGDGYLGPADFLVVQLASHADQEFYRLSIRGADPDLASELLIAKAEVRDA
jgi:hypothetical protein